MIARLLTWLKDRSNAGSLAIALYLLSLGMPMNAKIPLAILSLGCLAVPARQHRLNAPSIGVALAVFVLASLLSGLASIDHARTLATSFAWLPAALLFYLITYHSGKAGISVICHALTTLSLMIACYLLAMRWQVAQNDPTAWLQQAGYPHLKVPNDLLMIAVLAPFARALSRLECHTYCKTYALLSLLLTLITIVLFRSKAAFIIFLVSVIASEVLNAPKRACIGLVTAVLLGIAIDATQGFPFLEKILNSRLWSNRVPLWIAAWKIFLDAPILGQGPGSFAVINEAYLQHIELPDWVIRDSRHAPWAHSLYLELLAERGLVGAASFIYLMAIVCRALWKKIVSTPHSEYYHISVATAASLLGMLLASIFELSLVRYWVIIVFSLLIALASIVVDKT